MLKIIQNEDLIFLNQDDYCITEKYNGLDELEFTVSLYDKNYAYVLEEAVVREEQDYTVKAIDAGKDTATVKCQLDLDALRTEMHIPYSNHDDTVLNTISNVLPAGWTAIDLSENYNRKTVEKEAATCFDIINECLNIYDITVRYDNKAKTVTLINPALNAPKGAFLTAELNLTELNYKGKSSDFATRLYAYGKDNLTFAGINGGKEYISDTAYSNRTISVYWKDERYTDPESLLADARKQLTEIAVPQRSYSCNLLDLAKTNPEMYSFQDFSLHNAVILIDAIKNTRTVYSVVEYKRYPYYPEQNIVTLSSAAPKIQNTVKALQSEIKNPESVFRSNLQIAIEKATELIAGEKGGHLVIHTSADGTPNELLIMDTPDKATAKNVIRINMAGIGFSQNGYNGPFETAWTIDGHFNANYITAGTLNASLIKAGILQSQNGKSWINMETGEFCLTTTEGESIEDAVSQLQRNGQMLVVITASHGTALGRENLSTTLTATVYQHGTDITSKLQPGNFNWVKKSADAAADAIWNENHKGVGNSVTVTTDDVYQFGTVSCNVVD